MCILLLFKLYLPDLPGNFHLIVHIVFYAHSFSDNPDRSGFCFYTDQFLRIFQNPSIIFYTDFTLSGQMDQRKPHDHVFWCICSLRDLFADHVPSCLFLPGLVSSSASHHAAAHLAFLAIYAAVSNPIHHLFPKATVPFSPSR